MQLHHALGMMQTDFMASGRVVSGKFWLCKVFPVRENSRLDASREGCNDGLSCCGMGRRTDNTTQT